MAGPFVYEHRRMENDLIALVPFDPAIHSAKWFTELQANPSFVKYTPFPPISSETELREMFQEGFSPPSTDRVYAIYDKARDGNGEDTCAGFAGVSSKEAKNKTIELGCLLFPAFHRTHVATNTVGLLLLWSLDPPSLGGMGLRRVEWKCHTHNNASRKFAERMGFELEGISRWERLFPEGEFSLPVEALEKRNGKKEDAAGCSYDEAKVVAEDVKQAIAAEIAT